MRDDENLTAERPTFVTHLECSASGARYPSDELHNLSRERKPLIVRYDLDGVKKALRKEALTRRTRDLWRYRALLRYPAPGRAGHAAPGVAAARQRAPRGRDPGEG